MIRIMKKSWAAYAAFTLVACGVDSNELEQQYKMQLVEQEQDADENLAGVELTGSEVERERRAELSDENKARLASIEELLKTVGDQVLECAGIKDEFSAFRGQVEALRAEGKSEQQIREALKDEHESLRAKLDENREKFRECREQSKESEIGLVLKDVMDSCFSKPDHTLKHPEKGRGRMGKGRVESEDDSKERSGRGRHKGKHKQNKGEQVEPKGLRMPPLKFQELESQQCVDALAKAETFKGSTAIEPEASTEQTSEVQQ
jgi:hypothetical protein